MSLCTHKAAKKKEQKEQPALPVNADRVRGNGLKLKQTAVATRGDVSITWGDVSLSTSGITSCKIWNGTGITILHWNDFFQ